MDFLRRCLAAEGQATRKLHVRFSAALSAPCLLLLLLLLLLSFPLWLHSVNWNHSFRSGHDRVLMTVMTVVVGPNGIILGLLLRVGGRFAPPADSGSSGRSRKELAPRDKGRNWQVGVCGLRWFQRVGRSFLFHSGSNPVFKIYQRFCFKSRNPEGRWRGGGGAPPSPSSVISGL